MSSVSAFIPACVMGGRRQNRRPHSGLPRRLPRAADIALPVGQRHAGRRDRRRGGGASKEIVNHFGSFFGGFSRRLAAVSYAEMSGKVDTVRVGFDIGMDTGAAIGSRAWEPKLQ
jgi:hypothetical protein